MVLQRGNHAIGSHAAEGKSLLLFRKTAEGLREMVYEKYHTEKAPEMKAISEMQSSSSCARGARSSRQQKDRLKLPHPSDQLGGFGRHP
jgi:hypothetical protein